MTTFLTLTSIRVTKEATMKTNINIHQLKNAILTASISVALTACGGGGDSKKADIVVEPSPIVIDYQTEINSIVSENIPGVVLLVESPEKRFIGSAGMENTENQRQMEVYHTMPTGSSGKPMIGLLAAMLADDNLLDLDNTIDTWLSDEILRQIPNSSEVTLRQLLNHTSGIYNYVDSDDYLNLLTSDPEMLKTDIDFLPLALNKPASFKPGQGNEYSNTGYLLAGLILDKVLGAHHSVALRERILTPLGLNATYYRGVEKNHGEFISGYHTFDNNDTYNTKVYQENVAVASSPLVSNVEDMALFMKSAVAEQSFINDDIRDDFIGAQQLIPNDNNGGYGLGIIVENINGNTAYYHGGTIHGYHTQNVFVKEKNLSITAFINCSTKPVCENAMDVLVDKVMSYELKD